MNPGDLVGPYQIVRRIGSGGMAEVFEAVRPGIGGFKTRVALKCLQYSDDPRFVQLFMKEAHLGAQLRHANIVHIQDFNYSGNFYYIAMEMIDGVDLQTVLGVFKQRGGTMPPVMALQIILQVLAGLSYAHRALDHDGQPMGLIHRDIKPANILLSHDGLVKIVDFGVAKTTQKAFMTTEAVPRGTLAYMSPEQVAGEAVLLPASDLFGVGAILYEMLMQETLYQEDSYPRFLMAVGEADVRHQLKAFKARHPALHRILKKTLARDVRSRYQTADELAADLLNVLPKLEPAMSIAELIRSIAGEKAVGRFPLPNQPDPVDAAAHLQPPLTRPGYWRLREARLRRAAVGAGIVSGLLVLTMVAVQELAPGAGQGSTGPAHGMGLEAEGAAVSPSGALRYPSVAAPAGMEGGSSSERGGEPNAEANAPGATSASSLTAASSASSPSSTSSAPRPVEGRPQAVSTPSSHSSSPVRPASRPVPDSPAAPPAKRPAGEGVLVVGSVPPDADLFVDGVKVCEVPCERKLSAGNHALELRSHDGHHRKAFETQIEPDHVRKMIWDFEQKEWLAR